MNISQGNPGLLIYDNHSSHIIIGSIIVAKESGLTLLILPPHCSHRMQPLDVGVVAQFKRFYAHYADVWQRSNPGRATTIYEIESLASSAIIKAFTLENIKPGFKSTGIYPLNSDVYLTDSFLPSLVTDSPHEVKTSSQEDGLEGESHEISAEQNQPYRMAT